jgi:hypothetical protein
MFGAGGYAATPKNNIYTKQFFVQHSQGFSKKYGTSPDCGYPFIGMFPIKSPVPSNGRKIYAERRSRTPVSKNTQQNSKSTGFHAGSGNNKSTN